MEVETRALLDVLESELLTSKVCLTVDVHRALAKWTAFGFLTPIREDPFPT